MDGPLPPGAFVAGRSGRVSTPVASSMVCTLSLPALGGNRNVWVGVFGDESAADSGDESVSRGGGGGLYVLVDGVRLGSVEATEDSPSPLPEPAALWMPKLGGMTVGDLTKVAWLDVLETLDLSSFLDVEPDTQELRDLGRSSLASSLTDKGVPDRRLLFCEAKSVSGGVGGRLLAAEDALLEEVELFRVSPADCDRFMSVLPRSVGSGVKGSERRAAGAGIEMSSLLWTNSLLWALLKVG